VSSAGIRRSRSTDSRVAESILDEDRRQIESEKIFKETGDANTSNSAGLANTISAAGNFLSKDGDSRGGPMGNDIGIANVINDTIEIALGIGTYKPSLILNGEGGADDILSTIIPGENVRLEQELIIQAGIFAITLKDGVGNILTLGGADLILEPSDYAKLIFSVLAGGKWVVAWSSSGSGISFPLLYPKESLTPFVSFNQTIDLCGNALIL